MISCRYLELKRIKVFRGEKCAGGAHATLILEEVEEIREVVANAEVLGRRVPEHKVGIHGENTRYQDRYALAYLVCRSNLFLLYFLASDR